VGLTLVASVAQAPVLRSIELRDHFFVALHATAVDLAIGTVCTVSPFDSTAVIHTTIHHSCARNNLPHMPTTRATGRHHVETARR
jgi:hypothetical protein